MAMAIVPAVAIVPLLLLLLAGHANTVCQNQSQWWCLLLWLWRRSSVSLRCCLVSSGVFWIASPMGLWADHLVATKQSPLLKACKIRSGIIISGRDRIDLVALAVLNTTIVTALAACPIVEWVWIWLVPDRPIESETDVWMAIWTNEAFIKLPIHALVAEAAFYVVHGLLHYSSFLYQTIHRVHHRFPAPTAMACVYAHPLEFVVGNVFPVFLGPILTNAHPATCYLWFALAMLGTCKGHCGYRLFGVCDPHEDHHRWYRYNYGAMGLLDPLLGTTPPRQQHTKSSPQPPP